MGEMTMKNRKERKERKEYKGAVYFARKEGTTTYKVGCSRKPFMRVNFIQGYCKDKLEIVLMIYSDDIYKDEYRIHKALEYYKIQGEWYNITNYNDLVRIAKHYGENVVTLGYGKITEGNRKLAMAIRGKTLADEQLKHLALSMVGGR